MAFGPNPLFENFEAFLDQDFSRDSSSINFVNNSLGGFPAELAASAGYRAVRSFLRAYEGSEQTFNS
jgi:hypothetical protein